MWYLCLSVPAFQRFAQLNCFFFFGHWWPFIYQWIGRKRDRESGGRYAAKGASGRAPNPDRRLYMETTCQGTSGHLTLPGAEEDCRSRPVKGWTGVLRVSKSAKARQMQNPEPVSCGLIFGNFSENIISILGFICRQVFLINIVIYFDCQLSRLYYYWWCSDTRSASQRGAAK